MQALIHQRGIMSWNKKPQIPRIYDGSFECVRWSHRNVRAYDECDWISMISSSECGQLECWSTKLSTLEPPSMGSSCKLGRKSRISGTSNSESIAKTGTLWHIMFTEQNVEKAEELRQHSELINIKIGWCKTTVCETGLTLGLTTIKLAAFTELSMPFS